MNIDNKIEMLKEQLKMEFPNCKFNFIWRASGIYLIVNIYLTNADFEMLSKSIGYTYQAISFNGFTNNESLQYYEDDEVYLTTETKNFFKQIIKILQSLELQYNVYVRGFIGKPEFFEIYKRSALGGTK